MNRWLFVAVPLLVHAIPAQNTLIPYTRFTLDNGLTVIVHEDHKAPIVAVNVWYHVGSKNEKPGRTGLAHLFEHLMFNGSQHFNDDYFKAVEKVGATELNGSTCEDFTNYFQTVPKDALDTILWLESDRMAHTLGVLTQSRLDEQRGVVQNEKRQYENQPYSIAWQLMTENLWPRNHPYSWPVIGSMEDLTATTLEDTHAWFKTWYGAANATLVLAGDITAEEARQRVTHFFGSIPGGSPPARHKEWIAKRTGTLRQVAEDRVPQCRIYMAWNTPPYGTQESLYLDLVGRVLADGNASRLVKKLVDETSLLTSVSAWNDAGEIAGTFLIVASLAPQASEASVEQLIRAELQRLIAEGPTSNEVQRIKNTVHGEHIRRLERIGGFGGKGQQLAKDAVLLDDPDYFSKAMQIIQSAHPADLQRAARAWLSDGEYVLTIRPRREHTVTTNSVDRSTLPLPTTHPQSIFPSTTSFVLSNNLHVTYVQRLGLPLINMRLILPCGYATVATNQAGLATLCAELLTESTQQHTSAELSEHCALLGAQLNAACNADHFVVYLSALSAQLEPSLDLYREIIVTPGFTEKDIANKKAQRSADIQRAQREPIAIAHRLLPALLYGKNHPLGYPASGTEVSINALTQTDFIAFHRAGFQPDQATLLAIGDVPVETMKRSLEKALCSWQPTTPRSALKTSVPIQTVPHSPRVILVDRPNSIQSAIVVAQRVPRRTVENALPVDLMNYALGGSFTARINMNLREDKHWTYGAYSSFNATQTTQFFLLNTQVQADKTIDALREIQHELQGFLTTNRLSQAEFMTARQNVWMKIAARWETQNSVLDTLEECLRFAWPADYPHTLSQRLERMTLRESVNAATNMLTADAFTWIVVGNRGALEAPLRALNLGPVEILTAE